MLIADLKNRLTGPTGYHLYAKPGINDTRNATSVPPNVQNFSNKFAVVLQTAKGNFYVVCESWTNCTWIR